MARPDPACPDLRRLQAIHRQQAALLAGPRLAAAVAERQESDLQRHLRDCPRCNPRPSAVRKPAPPKARPSAPDPVAKALRTVGVPPDASPDVIRSSYRAHAQLFHPDKARHLDAAARRVADARMKELNAAYDVLKKAGKA